MIALTTVLLMILPGCLEESILIEEKEDWDSEYYLIEPPETHEDPRNFTVGHPNKNETWGNASW